MDSTPSASRTERTKKPVQPTRLPGSLGSQDIASQKGFRPSTAASRRSKRTTLSRESVFIASEAPLPVRRKTQLPSRYTHLSEVDDHVRADLLVLFVGCNPGIQTARSGHHYAHPSNRFWKLLFSSGITPRPCRPEEDQDMPELYSLGFTNLVQRPSRNSSELSKQEMDGGVVALHEKARRWRPECLCIVGKGIWESMWRVTHGFEVGASFKYGWQDPAENVGAIAGEWEGAKVFVASSTSGLAASLSQTQKQDIWSQLGCWVKQRRVERGRGNRTEMAPHSRVDLAAC